MTSAGLTSEGVALAQVSPLVSIIVPTHISRPPFLAEALASVIAQDWTNREVIVVDDGSPAPGALAELVSVDERIRVVRQKRGAPPRPGTAAWLMPAATWWRSSTTTTCGTPGISRRRSRHWPRGRAWSPLTRPSTL